MCIEGVRGMGLKVLVGRFRREEAAQTGNPTPESTEAEEVSSVYAH